MWQAPKKNFQSGNLLKPIFRVATGKTVKNIFNVVSPQKQFSLWPLKHIFRVATGKSLKNHFPCGNILKTIFFVTSTEKLFSMWQDPKIHFPCGKP